MPLASAACCGDARSGRPTTVAAGAPPSILMGAPDDVGGQQLAARQHDAYGVDESDAGPFDGDGRRGLEIEAGDEVGEVSLTGLRR